MGKREREGTEHNPLEQILDHMSILANRENGNLYINLKLTS